MNEMERYLLNFKTKEDKIKVKKEWYRTSNNILFLVFIGLPLGTLLTVINQWGGLIIMLVWTASVLISHIIWKKKLIKEFYEGEMIK